MTSNKDGFGEDRHEPPKPKNAKQPAETDKDSKPEWAGGLQQLYNSVVDEPLPDSFKDLLAQLDADK